MAGGILLSRLAGLVREIAIGGYLGVGAAADAFKAALRIPNLLQNLLGEGVLSASFIPVYARLLDEDEAEAGRVAGAVAGLLAAAAGVIALIGVVFARPITIALTPGFEGERLELTVDLVRIMTPGIAFLVLSAWCLGVLNSHRRFFLAYVAPVLWNAAQIAVVVFLGIRGATDRSIATGLAWGVAVGGVLQLVVQLPSVIRVGRGIRPSLDRTGAGVREVGRRFVPVLLGRGVVQLVGYVDLFLASLLAVGAVSAFTYAQVLYLLPISLFGMSVAAAELPELARLGADGAVEVRRRLDVGLGRIAFFVAPVQALYLAAGSVIAAALLQRGDFTADDARLVWFVLAGSSVALLATTASRLLQNALYGLGDSRTPARVAALRVAVAAVLGALLMFQGDRLVLQPGTSEIVVDGELPAPLTALPESVRIDEAAPLRLGAVGLTVASSVGAWLELALLRRAVRRRVGAVLLGGTHRFRVLGAATLAGVVALALRWSVAADAGPLLAAVIVLVPAGLAYLLVTSVTGVPEAAQLLRRRRRERDPQPGR
ncbi:MAG: murein biosynthesis integral membrane protein MurJ [Acidimicrobiia bacterium]|nr:murein biosynthesis integral membrane protein MurJ [Acidimicrobiia bacterium]